MTSVIYFLILFFFLLILCQIFLAHIENIVEGMENKITVSTTKVKPPLHLVKASSGISSSHPAISSSHPTVSSSHPAILSSKPETINASSVNSINPSYMPYESTSENMISFVEQNANNIAFLKNQYDNLYQQVQDISGNITNIDNKANLAASQATHVNSIVTQAQSAMPKTPPKITGTSQSPKTIADVTGYASGN